MKLLFPALETAFDGDATLKASGRKLYEGLDIEKSVSPHVLVERLDAPEPDFDTFETRNETYTLKFRIRTSRHEPVIVRQIVEDLRAVFDDVDLSGTGPVWKVIVGGFRWLNTGQTQYNAETGSYETDVDYTVIINRADV